MKKHTIKLLTLAFMLAAILTLTGCPGPVTPDMPCTHENTRTEVIEEATYNKDGLGKIICVDCEKVIDEQATISRFVAGGYDGDIPAETENPETYHYQYNKEDDYQISLSIYSSEEDTKPIKTLYFSFEKDILSNYSEIEFNNGYWIKLSSLLQMKPEYYNCEVKKFKGNSEYWIVYEDNGNICWQSLTGLCDFNYKIMITNQ